MNKVEQNKSEAQNELNDVAAEYTQAAFEALHVEDLIGHIPVIKTGLAAAKLIGSLRDHLLLRKIGIYGNRQALLLPQPRHFSTLPLY